MSCKRSSSSPCQGPGSKQRKIEDEMSFLIIYSSPMSLKHLSALKIALSVWCHHNIRFSKKYGYGSLKYNTRNVHDSFVYVPSYVNGSDYNEDTTSILIPIKNAIVKLSLPKLIKNLVEDYCKFLQRELRYWAYCHDTWISLESVSISDIVWRYDGFVDHLATVRKMLASCRFTLEERFNLMSVYCLENEIQSISQSVINEKFMKKIDSYWDGNLQFYWKFYLHNALSRLDTRGDSSLNSRMLFSTAQNNPASLAYFFNRLNDDEIVVSSIHLINQLQSEFKYRYYVLSKLNRFHHHQVLMKCAASVIIDLARFHAYENYVSNVWISYKEHINKEQFFQIVFNLFQHGDIDETNVDHTETLLCDIWDTATDEMKNHIWQNYYNYFLENCFRLKAERWVFFKKMFSDASLVTKNKIVNDPKFISFCASSIGTGQWYLCNNFIALCFSSADRVVEFKKTLFSTNEMMRYCRELIKKSQVKKLQQLLALYLPDTDSIMAYKKDLLASKAVLKSFCFAELFTDRVEELIETLDHVLPTPESAADYRKELALEPPIVKMLCQHVNNGKFDKTKALVDRLLVRDEDFEPVKLKLWAFYKKIFQNGKCVHLKKVEWDKFLSWRSNSGKEQFKETLPLDDIFMKMLKRSVPARVDNLRNKKDLNVESCFEELDYFLRWYFDTEDQISRYKMKKINEYDESTVIATILKNSSKSGLAKAVLEWFFDNDQQQIDDFKRTYSLDTSVLLTAD